jgi:flagellin-like hook-associated protein FlgL
MGNDNSAQTPGVTVTATGKGWYITILIFLVAQTFGAIWWAGSINERVKRITSLETQYTAIISGVNMALDALKTHGAEMGAIRMQISKLQGNDDELRKTLATNMDDRFRDQDWDAASKILADQRTADQRYWELRMSTVETQVRALANWVEAYPQNK